MNQFIDNKYKFCIDVDYLDSVSKKASKMEAMFNRHATEKNNQITAGIQGTDFHAIKLTPEKTYDWHFDSCNWYHKEQKLYSLILMVDIGLILFILQKVHL